MALKYKALVRPDGDQYTADVEELNAHTWADNSTTLHDSIVEAIQVALDTDEEVEVELVDEGGTPFKFPWEPDTLAEMRGEA